MNLKTKSIIFNTIQNLTAILDIAVSNNASDIHFETYKSKFRIRFRIDGVLHEYKNEYQKHFLQIISRIKILSNLNIAEKRLPQDGHFSQDIQNQKIEFRVSTCPTIFGEKIVLRLLFSASNNISIVNLGMESWQEKIFLKTLNKSQGLILITGPTGSGKTSSLYAGLNHLNSIEKNILTVEDPVEINLTNINQVNINNKIGVNYSNILKTFLRQDPDVIMIGEIREQIVAEIVIKASQTGHLILSTLHTKNAIEAIDRLNYLGISLYNILTNVNLIISQRLVRKLCKYCKIQKKQINEKHLIKVGFTKEELNNIILYGPNNKGCINCIYGYKNRVGVFELLPIEYNINQINNACLNKEYLLSLIKTNYSSLVHSLKNKLIKGITSIEEIYKHI